MKIKKQAHMTNYWYFKQKLTFEAEGIANTTLNTRKPCGTSVFLMLIRWTTLPEPLK